MEDLTNTQFSGISWWTTDIDNLSRCSGVALIELAIRIDGEQADDYISDRTEVIQDYTFGRAEYQNPKRSIWYSIGEEYLRTNKVSIREVSA